MHTLPNQDLILQKIKEKSVTKYEVYDNTYSAFKLMKEVAKDLVTQLKAEMEGIQKPIPIEFKERGAFEFNVKFAADLLVVTMHTNVFEFPREHDIMKTSYVKKDPMRSYCGVIHMYNFLADSFKYNRYNDLGYLIGRVFINKEKHYFVEGKRQLGFLYNNFVNEVIDSEAIKKILETYVLYCIDFDLLTPPYEAIKQVTVHEMQQISSAMNLKTGKRLGFKFSVEKDKPLP